MAPLTLQQHKASSTQPHRMLALLTRSIHAPSAQAALRITLAPSASLARFHAFAPRLSYPTGRTGKPLNAYARFSKEKWPEIKSEDPSVTVPEAGKKIGQLWRSLPDAEKERYKSEANSAFSAYKKSQ